MAAFRAQHSSGCKKCGGLIVPGARIQRGQVGWVHADCSKADVDIAEPVVLGSPEKRLAAERGYELAMRVMRRSQDEQRAAQEETA